LNENGKVKTERQKKQLLHGQNAAALFYSLKNILFKKYGKIKGN